MKILFVYPGIKGSDNYNLNKVFNKIFSSEPPSFGILAALTPPSYQIDMIDDSIQKIDYNQSCDLVCITVYTMNAPRAYQIADEFRKKGVKVVLGGWHPSALPNEAKQHADSVVIGEAEEIWPQLLKDFENSCLKSFYNQLKIVNPLKIPTPRRIFNKRHYLSASVQASRGCPNRCFFCAMTNRKYGRIYRTRPVKEVIEEIKNISPKFFQFNDNSLTIDPIYSKELFISLKNLNKKFFCNGNINILNRDENLLKLASDAGCCAWAIGLESVSQESINYLGKKTNKIKEYASTIKKIHDHGMMVLADFIFGFDTDNIDIFNKTKDMVSDMNLDLVTFNVLTPLPGTPLFDKLKKERRILTEDWSKYDFKTVVFKPKNMSPEELQNNTIEIQKIFSSYFNIMKNIARSIKFGFYPFVFATTINFQEKSAL